MTRIPWSVLLAVVFVVSSAFAQAPSTSPATDAEVTASKTETSTIPWRGSKFIYGHAFTALTLHKGAEPFYNPQYGHRLELQPEWHFNDQYFLRGRLELSQELTISDETRYRHEVVASDVRVEGVMEGWTEPRTQILVTPNLRLTLPLSKKSQAQTMVVALAPGVTLSRAFTVGQGLNVAYGLRYQERFHRFTTMQTDGPQLSACVDLGSFDCAESVQTGKRNVRRDFVHGPTVVFTAHERVTLTTAFLLSHGFLYGLAAAPEGVAQSNGLVLSADTGVRNLTRFDLQAEVNLVRGLSVAVGASTLSSQPGPSGRFVFPFFNRDTVLFVDFGVNVEGLLATK
jgi:hypothetical protein